MRFTTHRKYEPELQAYIPTTTLHLDCTHQLYYYGTPNEADHILKVNGGTSSGGLTRCKECSARVQALVQAEIRQAREMHR